MNSSRLKQLKIDFATHTYVYVTRNIACIAKIINTSVPKLHKWMDSDAWTVSMEQWGQAAPKRNGNDLDLAEALWTDLFDENTPFTDNLSEYANVQLHTECPNYAIIQSHLSCVDGLCDEQIRQRLAEEREYHSQPVRFEKDMLSDIRAAGYLWWLYPNADESSLESAEGIYSKVLARVNPFNDLVVSAGEETCLVAIKHGRLTLTRNSSDDVINVFDKRLLVCL